MAGVRVRVLIGGVVAGLVVSMVGVFPAAAAPQAPQQEQPAPESPAVSEDEGSALAAAAQRGERVEILPERTEFSQTFATPHGTLVLEEHLRPQWVQVEDGSWVDADATLREALDGSLEPAATTAEMAFSGGGTADPLAEMNADGASVGLWWPDELPAPVVEGNVATYRNVAPYVDLQVVADVDGFTHLVIIHSPKALESPKVREIALETDLSGVSLRETETGAVEAVDTSGDVVFAGPSPMMWDSRDASAAGPAAKPEGQPDAADEAGPVDVQPRTAPVEVELAGDELQLTPDEEMLTDPDTVYPVYVDPTWIKVTGKRNKWSLLRKSFPNSSFYNPAVGSTSSSDATRGIVRAGYVVEDRAYTDRSIFNMSTSAVKYKRVNKAVFSLTQSWSWYNCGSSTKPVTQLRSVGSFSSSTTWNNQPSWGSVLATSNKIRKYGYSCGPQRVEYNVTSHVRNAASSGKSAVNLGLRAKSETTGNWTRFKNDAKLAIEYNTAPNAASTLKVQGKGCATGSSRPYVTVDRPTFSGRISDPDSGQQSMSVRFYWWKSSQSRGSDYVTASSANPGTANSSSIPSSKALLDRQVYKYQARVSDGIDASWSKVCEFRAWLTPPGPPTDVTSAVYPEYDPNNPGPGSGGVGIPGQFTISPPATGVADVVGYAYTLDSGVSASAAPTVSKGSGGSATVTLRPRRDGLNVLRVWSKDVAGRFSSAVEYQFEVRPGDGPVAHWTFEDALAPGLDDTGHGNSITLYHGAGTAPGRAGVGSALLLDGADDLAKADGVVTQPHPDTGQPVAFRTDSTFTVAAWVQLEATGSSVRTAVSADGNRVSAFMLGYSGPDNRWRFAMAASDADSPSLPRVFSNAAPVAGRWTHLAGTYDAATGALRLYVNGVLQDDSATLTGGFDASGAVVVGRRKWNGSFSNHFNGRIDDVRLYSFIPPVSNVVAMAQPLPPVVTFPDGDTAQAGGTLQVRFDAGGDTNITSFAYSVGSDALDQTVALGTAGGTATVTVPVSTAGDLPVFAASVDRLSRLSESASASATVFGDPEVSGVVYDVVTEQPVAGATVMLDQAGLEVTSEPDGTFSFAGFDSGIYTLAAHLGGQCGMATATELELTAPEVVELWLTPAKDDFGYECQEAPGTPFSPIGGSALSLTGDDAVTSVSLPFPFLFYGESYTTAWVDTNGVIAFDDPGGSHPGGEATIPAAIDPNALIAPYWADLVVDSQASVHTEAAGAAPRRVFAIEWRNVHLKGDSAARIDLQVKLWEDGFIHLSYSGLDSGPEQGQGAVVGVESPGGQVGVQYSYKQSVLADDLLVVFPYPQDPNPITTVTLSGTVVDSASGTPAEGVPVTLEPSEVTVTTDSAGGFSFPDLEWGSYLVEARSGAHCARAGQETVELEATSDVQVELQPTTDEYGYLCAPGPRTFAPVSTQLSLSGDDSNQSVSLPFPVTFYGETHTDVWVNTNGLLIFQPQPFPWWMAHEIPSVHNTPAAAVYAFWEDWVVDASASVWTGVNGTAPNRQFVVEWRNVHQVWDSSARVSFQVVFDEATGEIAVAWDDIGSTAVEQGISGVVGIENTDGTVALPYAVFEQAIATGQGVVFTPAPPGLHTVGGQVTCAGSPAGGVEVWLADQTTTTDAQGEFELTGLPPGPLGLVATAAGGSCAGSVTVPVTAVRGEPQWVDVELVEVALATGYTVSVASTTMLPTSTVVALGGDDVYTSVTPPFPVELYGQAYTTVWVDTNGYVTFEDGGSSAPIPFPIPSVSWSPDAAVYPLWDDWDVDGIVAEVRTGVHGSAPNRQWVVEWRDVQPINLWQRVSFQVVFDEATGQITFNYDDIGLTFVERGGAGLVGVENDDSTAAIQFSYLSPVLRTGRGIVFTPVP